MRDLAGRWPINGLPRYTDRERRALQAWGRQFEPVDASPAAREAADEAMLQSLAPLLDPLLSRTVPPLGLDRAHFLGIARRVRAEQAARRRRRAHRCRSTIAALVVAGVTAATGQPLSGGATLLGLMPPARIAVWHPGADSGRRMGDTADDGPDGRAS
ncbi:hypothetical protein AB0M46_26795 [Dactylosporangium sp. NPDC051485]|uniref:hypothetical protein n=1 Tax=Dactylosporangium sp. NPDC051485 TaxID=3154846 RepID=UPI003417DAEE